MFEIIKVQGNDWFHCFCSSRATFENDPASRPKCLVRRTNNIWPRTVTCCYPPIRCRLSFLHSNPDQHLPWIFKGSWKTIVRACSLTCQMSNRPTHDWCDFLGFRQSSPNNDKNQATGQTEFGPRHPRDPQLTVRKLTSMFPEGSGELIRFNDKTEINIVIRKSFGFT